MKKKTISSAMLTVLLSSTMLPTITAAQEMTTSSTTENAITSSEVVAEDKEEEKEEGGKHTTVSSAPREGIVGDIESGIEKDIQQAKNDAIQRIEKLAEAKLIDNAEELIQGIEAAAESGAETAVKDIEKIASDAEQVALTALKNRIDTALAELASVPGIVESDIKQFQQKIEASLAKDAGVAIDELLTIEKDVQTAITDAKNDVEKDLATAKADAIAEIKKLENLGETEVEGWIKDIEGAVDQEAVKAVTALANDISNWRTAELAKLHKLENLADSEIKQFEQDIMNNVEKDLIEAVTAGAAALSKLRTDAINDILRLEKLGKLAETDAKQFIDKIMQETEQKAIDEITAAAEALQDIRNDAKAEIDKLVKDGELAEEDAKAYITKIEQTIEADVISGLVKAAGEIDKLRQDAIDEINQLLENGKIAEEDAEQFIAKVKQEVEADVIAEITKAANEIQGIKEKAEKDIQELVDAGKLAEEEAAAYLEKIKGEIEADVIGGIVEAAKGLEDARNEIIKELEHLRDMGIIAEEEFEALVEKLKSSIETDILDAEMLIHLEAAKAKAILEIDALELVGAITPEQAEVYREEVKAATKPSEVAAVMAKISIHRDFKALNDAIAKAKLKDQHNYMPNSWTSFEIALRHAEEVSETEDSAKPATQIEINDAFDHLLLAELKLERVASTKAIDHLQDAIRVAHSKKEKDYTKESWADMQTVLGEAEAMLAKLDGNVDAFTEKEVNDMTRKLNLAMLSMKRVDGIGGITNPIKPHTPTKPAAFKPAAAKPAAASASAPSASAPSASAPKAAASSLPKTGEVTHSLMSAGLLALGMAGYFYMSRKRLEVSGDINEF